MEPGKTARVPAWPSPPFLIAGDLRSVMEAQVQTASLP
jgi:hypothetical protein